MLSKGGGVFVQGGFCSGGSLSGGGPCPGGCQSGGSLSREASVQGHLCPEGVPVQGGLCLGGGLCPGGWGGSVTETPPLRWKSGRAGGKHPTGMHSFLVCK